MNKALVDAGNPPEGMIIQSGEMHGFSDEKNSLKLYTEMLAFFRRNIGGKVDAGAPENATRSPRRRGSRGTGTRMLPNMQVVGRDSVPTNADNGINHTLPPHTRH